MNQTTLAIRLGKCAIVLFIAMLALLVAFSNITDYATNYWFVVHVMKMDTTFPQSAVHYRAVQQPILYHVGYVFLILLQTIMAVFCLLGMWQMIKNVKQNRAVFHTAKRWAIYGFMIGIFIWFLCFEVIGGEWFSMWQSQQWNGLYSADRIVTFIMLGFIALMMKEED